MARIGDIQVGTRSKKRRAHAAAPVLTGTRAAGDEVSSSGP